MSIASVMPSNHLILCRPLLLLPSIFPSIRLFSNESVLPIIWPKYWSFSFSTSPSSEYSGLISFRRDWLDLLAVTTTTTLVPHVIGITQPVFCVWLISLSIMPTSFLSVVACGRVFFPKDWIIFHCIYRPHCFYPFICQWTLGSFHLLVIVN